MSPLLAWLGGGLVAVVAAWPKVVLPVWRAVRKVGHFIDDIAGEPAREGVPARAGVMARLQSIDDALVEHGQRLAQVEAQFKPNGGHSAMDKLDRIEHAVTVEDIPGGRPE